MSGGPSAARTRAVSWRLRRCLDSALVAEPAEVDDPLDAFALGHPGEVAGADPLALGEAAAAGHRVDEVVGDLDSLARADEARGVGDVADVEVEARRLELRRPGAVADQAARPAPSSASDAASRPPTKPVAPAMRVLCAIGPRYPTGGAGLQDWARGEHLLERSQRVEVPAEQRLRLLRRRRSTSSR